jgi:tRNA-dihydrouridine synthase A
MNLNFNRRLSVAPMLDYTDRHERYFLRLLSRYTLLYSEMITANALLHADPHRFLRHDTFEHPLAIQLGGSDPRMLAACAKMAEDAGFCEINLNCGCPSDRVQSGAFGACLMKEKQCVADCVSAMQAVVKIPVTVKTRIGIDHDDSWEFFFDFVKYVADAGCYTFIIHARKAWLKGLSPRENREKPPLNYDFVYRLKEEMPHLKISLNGGVRSMDLVESLLTRVDGVMVGREPYENPWFLADADVRIFGKPSVAPPTRKALLESFFPYMERELAKGCPLNIMTRHLFGLFNGFAGARRYRQILSEEAPRAGAGIETVKLAMNAVEETI